MLISVGPGRNYWLTNRSASSHSSRVKGQGLDLAAASMSPGGQLQLISLDQSLLVSNRNRINKGPSACNPILVSARASKLTLDGWPCNFPNSTYTHCEKIRKRGDLPRQSVRSIIHRNFQRTLPFSRDPYLANDHRGYESNPGGVIGLNLSCRL